MSATTERVYRTVDKSKWARGPWDNEPDKVQYTDEVTGLPCLIVRQGVWSGHLCGYVGVAPGHPCFGMGYGDVNVNVHGGLTYAAPCQEDEDEKSAVCHIPVPGEPDHVWWLGFDCAHAGDLSPGHNFGFSKYETYKTIEYVREQNRKLAEQLFNY